MGFLPSVFLHQFCLGVLLTDPRTSQKQGMSYITPSNSPCFLENHKHIL